MTGYLDLTIQHLQTAARLAQRSEAPCPACGGATLTDGKGLLCGLGHYAGEGAWPVTLAWGEVLYRELDQRIPLSVPRPPQVITVSSFDALYADIGEIVTAEHNGLRCRVCGHQEPMTADDAARYTARGWPRHCGETMQLVRFEEGGQ